MKVTVSCIINQFQVRDISDGAELVSSVRGEHVGTTTSYY
jgi:hypothetical protein